jgi:hypothetical protein
MEEIYRTIVGFEKYEVSNIGNVRNTITGRILKSGHASSGYYMVTLYSDKKITTNAVHRLVATTFLDNPDNKRCIDHIDNNKLNNNFTNLRYATHSENNQNRKIYKNNKSGSKGVIFMIKSNKWKAQIRIDDIYIYLGLYENKKDAIQARIIKANQVFGIYTNICEQINEI